MVSHRHFYTQLKTCGVVPKAQPKGSLGKSNAHFKWDLHANDFEFARKTFAEYRTHVPCVTKPEL
jgi:hypothetical protein